MRITGQDIIFAYQTGMIGMRFLLSFYGVHCCKGDEWYFNSVLVKNMLFQIMKIYRYDFFV